ncbi:MAG TPA: type II toxin-antitoxin system death-on-curing family toxin [Pyrinomonadaceae bacterium]|nr:type II toxin-antitoxin system death-on-curing family toxin [Pyrinomonadaceae bacterium]HMP65323.1 type II toxin-antitoxin system death-on-curing family toxin [Pyrinomonadaceae bacterium]
MKGWIKIDRVIAIHRRQIAEHGGADGVRDLGLLESALSRPQNIHTYEPDADIARLAAAYAFGIARNHPFIDGNKRTAYVVMETFIIKNGFQLTADPTDKYLTFISLAEGSLSEDELTEWLRERTEPAN